MCRTNDCTQKQTKTIPPDVTVKVGAPACGPPPTLLLSAGTTRETEGHNVTVLQQTIPVIVKTERP